MFLILFPHSIYIGFRLFRQCVHNTLEGTKEACLLGGLFCRRQVLTVPAPPRGRALDPSRPWYVRFWTRQVQGQKGHSQLLRGQGHSVLHLLQFNRFLTAFKPLSNCFSNGCFVPAFGVHEISLVGASGKTFTRFFHGAFENTKVAGPLSKLFCRRLVLNRRRPAAPLCSPTLPARGMVGISFRQLPKNELCASSINTSAFGTRFDCMSFFL